MAVNEKIDFDTAKILISEYKIKKDGIKLCLRILFGLFLLAVIVLRISTVTCQREQINGQGLSLAYAYFSFLPILGSVSYLTFTDENGKVIMRLQPQKKMILRQVLKPSMILLFLFCNIPTAVYMAHTLLPWKKKIWELEKMNILDLEISTHAIIFTLIYLRARRTNMIQYYNRKTGQYEIEKVAGDKYLTWLYSSPVGMTMLEMLVKKKFFSRLYGKYCDSKLSARKIPKFIEEFQIDMSVCENQSANFNNFNDFFVRKVTAEGRPVDMRPSLSLLLTAD